LLRPSFLCISRLIGTRCGGLATAWIHAGGKPAERLGTILPVRALQNDLVYDVGMNDGSDTGYYLNQGFRVVAIDADPAMIENGRQKFAREVAEERLTLLNVGVSSERGTATFWICEDKAEWNSFDRARASHGGRPHHSVEIPTIPFGEVLEQYGVPYFLKIDIEGHDHYCVADLQGGPIPTFLSTEVQAVPDGGLGLLEQVGYQRFKLIRQKDWCAARKRGTLQHLLTSAAYGRLRPLRLAWLTRRFTDRYAIESLRYRFEEGSSGPWGKDTPGPWLNPAQARATLLAERERVRRSGIDPIHMWWDWHATL